MKNFIVVIFVSSLVALSFGIVPAHAEDVASTTVTVVADVASATSTDTVTSSPADTIASSTSPVTATTTEPVSPPPPPAPEPVPPPAPVSSAPLVSTPPPVADVIELPPVPQVAPVVPIEYLNGKGFDPVVAPSKVRLKVVDSLGNVPTIPVFVTFVGVGGRTYGGPVDKEGILETVMPTGRYYSDFLVIDTRSGPPNNPPSFFLEANEDRDLGIFTLTSKSSFTDSALEAEVASALQGESGMAKIFALVVKLLLAILKEVRGIRVDLLNR